MSNQPTVKFSTLKDGENFYKIFADDHVKYTKGQHHSYQPASPEEDFHPNSYKLTDIIIHANFGAEVQVIPIEKEKE